MTNNEPTMVDAAAAIIAEDGPDSPALDLLSTIGRQMERDAEHRQGIMDSWAAKDNGRRLLLEHGIQNALNNCEWGGTTRQYEETLGQIERVLELSRAGTAFANAPLQFYIDQCKEEPGGMAPLNPKVWPGFKSLGYGGRWD